MKRELVIRKLKEEGFRITKQRLLLLDVILEGDCTCCKDIYYRAVKVDPGIGTATVYRMINTLERIGAISRTNMYRIGCEQEEKPKCACLIRYEDDTDCALSQNKWKEVIQSGLESCGYTEKKIKNVTVYYARQARVNDEISH